MSAGNQPSRGLVVAALVTLLALAGCSERSATDSTSLDPPAGGGAMAPRWASLTAGVLLTWLEPQERGHRLMVAHLDAASSAWSEPRAIAAGEGFFANWADLPGAVQEAGGRITAHWLERLGSARYAYGVRFARSIDDGRTWTAGDWLHDDTSPTEHGFVSWLGTPGGAQAYWLDGRATETDGFMQLRATQLDGTGGPRPSSLLDDRVCDCCATDAAMTSRGPIVVYRDRTVGELRDIAYVVGERDGYTEPAMIHDDGWEINACPVNGPAVATDGADRVAVAWFTAAQEQPRVLLAFSADAGRSFSAPLLVDEERPIGRVDVALDDDGSAVVCWMGSTDTGAEIRTQRLAATGSRGTAQLVTTTTPARSAGFPTIVREGKRFLVAWVEDVTPSRLRVTSVARNEL